ncbi:MAG: glycosyltransferase, partial [Planctomycetota bacterium]|nr:glycosyltransferase [Planctomycetota bacterium]
PLVNNFNGQEWEGENTAKSLASPEVRTRLVRELLTYVRNATGAGLCLDFEDLPTPEPLFRKPRKGPPRPVPQSPPYAGFLQFVNELSAALKAAKLQLAVNVPFGRAEFPYQAVASVADYVVLVAYDQHWSGGEAGPIAAQPWFGEGLKRAALEIPPEKLVVAMGNYAYDWSEKKAATVLTCEEALRLARNARADWHWDQASLNPSFAYQDGQQRLHQVWLLDATTACNQLAAARAQHARGAALWRLGSEDPTVWRIWRSAIDSDAVQALTHVPVSAQMEFTGSGEVMRVTGAPAPGVREIAFDPQSKQIMSARYSAYPTPYVLHRYGAVPRKIVLTFDDGPDPEYTPAVLDALKEAQAPAVFFIVGLKGEHYPELVDRILAEGHELGNHTFSHPNVSKVPLRQLELELAATQRFLESRTGRQTLLFRPPFGMDTEPRTLEEIQTVEAVSQLGYLTVGMRLDPRDWTGSSPEELVEKTLDAAEDGVGNVVLLHDSGGDRANTVKAVPLLIQELRGRGFEIVSLSTLLGLTRDQLMPPVSAGSLSTWFTRAGFSLITLGVRALELLFFVGILLGLARLAIIGVLAVVEHYRQRHLLFLPDYRPSVAVIVPAYNEEKVVVQTIASLLTADYAGPLEIIVVDDGSKDETCARACEAFMSDPRVKVFSKANGGKAAALNFGIQQTQAEIVVGLDADTVFRPDTISKLVRHFRAPGIGAAAGNAKVGNRLNILTRWQALEYITCQNLDRRAFSLLNCITVVPGAVGAWRRELVLEAGGFTHQTLAEDADLTMAIRRLGYRIVNEDEAIALTEAPDTVRAFIKQRFRWMFGTVQAVFHHRGALFNPRYGALGFVALPNILIFQVFFPLVSPIVDLTLLLSMATWAFEARYHPGHMPSGSWNVLLYYLLFLAVDYLAGLLAFLLEPKEDKKLLVWLFFQRFCYRQLMYYVAIKATVAALRGTAVGWGKLERKATVQA